MNVIDLARARRLAYGCVAAQALTTLAAAAVSLIAAGTLAGESALIGGGASTLASLVMVVLAFGPLSGPGAERMLLAFFLGEIAKLLVVIALLVLALRLLRIAPVALLAAYAATFLVYWVVLARALWSGRTAGSQGEIGSAGGVPREMV